MHAYTASADFSTISCSVKLTPIMQINYYILMDGKRFLKLDQTRKKVKEVKTYWATNLSFHKEYRA